jgi:hypothetical protein
MGRDGTYQPPHWYYLCHPPPHHLVSCYLTLQAAAIPAALASHTVNRHMAVMTEYQITSKSIHTCESRDKYNEAIMELGERHLRDAVMMANHNVCLKGFWLKIRLVYCKISYGGVACANIQLRI